MALLPKFELTRPVESLVVRGVHERLGSLTRGELVLAERGEERRFGAALTDDDPRVRIEVRDRAFWKSIAFRGSIGAAESWIRGEWHTDDLVGVIRLFARNFAANDALERGFARLSRPVLAAWHAVRSNTRSGSKRNISAHYDLSNEFFELLLDESMTYSCALYEREDQSLHEAQLAKLDRLCDLLRLGPDDHLLEIGTGWGALACHAARRHGCRVTTTTISREQHEVAVRRVREAGLEGRAEVLLQDYRDLRGKYDKLVSVEMIEAVGHRFYGTFFAKCAELLAEDGLMVMQAITIADRHYERARRSVDFIQRHVFPGSCIPSVTALLSAAAKESDLTPVALHDITSSYVRTLGAWRENLHAESDRIRALGFDERFLRLWDYYLAYSAGGFAERHIGDVHLALAKPRWQP